MRYYRCKCGDCTAFGSMSPYPCSKCNKCGSDLASSPDGHSNPLPHEFLPTLIETDLGEAVLSRCKWCHRTKKECDKEDEQL